MGDFEGEDLRCSIREIVDDIVRHSLNPDNDGMRDDRGGEKVEKSYRGKSDSQSQKESLSSESESEPKFNVELVPQPQIDWDRKVEKECVDIIHDSSNNDDPGYANDLNGLDSNEKGLENVNKIKESEEKNIASLKEDIQKQLSSLIDQKFVLKAESFSNENPLEFENKCAESEKGTSKNSCGSESDPEIEVHQSNVSSSEEELEEVVKPQSNELEIEVAAESNTNVESVNNSGNEVLDYIEDVDNNAEQQNLEKSSMEVEMDQAESSKGVDTSKEMDKYQNEELLKQKHVVVSENRVQENIKDLDNNTKQQNLDKSSLCSSETESEADIEMDQSESEKGDVHNTEHDEPKQSNNLKMELVERLEDLDNDKHLEKTSLNSSETKSDYDIEMDQSENNDGVDSSQENSDISEEKEDNVDDTKLDSKEENMKESTLEKSHSEESDEGLDAVEIRLEMKTSETMDDLESSLSSEVYEKMETEKDKLKKVESNGDINISEKIKDMTSASSDSSEEQVDNLNNNNQENKIDVNSMEKDVNQNQSLESEMKKKNYSILAPRPWKPFQDSKVTNMLLNVKIDKTLIHRESNNQDKAAFVEKEIQEEQLQNETMEEDKDVQDGKLKLRLSIVEDLSDDEVLEEVIEKDFATLNTKIHQLMPDDGDSDHIDDMANQNTTEAIEDESQISAVKEHVSKTAVENITVERNMETTTIFKQTEAVSASNQREKFDESTNLSEQGQSAVHTEFTENKTVTRKEVIITDILTSAMRSDSKSSVAEKNDASKDVVVDETVLKKTSSVVGNKDTRVSIRGWDKFLEDALQRTQSTNETLEFLKKGTNLRKIRDKGVRGLQLFKRKYVLDMKNLLLVWSPHRDSKLGCGGEPESNYINLKEIGEVRHGYETDTLHKLGLHAALPKFRSVNQKCAFSIIFKNETNRRELDLVADDEATRDAWVNGLKGIIITLKSLCSQKEYELFLKENFRKADVNKSGYLDFKEVSNLCSLLNIDIAKDELRRRFDESNEEKTDPKSKEKGEVLDINEFVTFYYKMMRRPEIDLLFKKYSSQDGKSDRMTASELMKFAKIEQKEDVGEEECDQFINNFESTDDKSSFSVQGFTHFLMFSDWQELMSPTEKKMTKPATMSHPLAHYWIASSHNTYLTGNQLNSDSSIDAYIHALKQGCRCVELDCWDGPDGEPIIYHGYTLTSKILFEEVIKACSKYAFEASVYPLILSIENHCSVEQQDKMADYMVKHLGEKLCKEIPNENKNQMPSPESLRNKILIKAKRLPAGASQDDDIEEDPEDDDDERDDGKKTKKQKISKKLSDLVNYIHAVHFKSFDESAASAKYFHMSSFGEAKTIKFAEDPDNGPKFVKYNCRQLSRIYPGGKRQDSSNLKIVQGWNAGCQIVALNYQTDDRQNFLNRARFSANGGSGYVLKPEFLRNPKISYSPTTNSMLDRNKFPGLKLKLEIISGQHIPRPHGVDKGEVIDPFVHVRVRGHDDDFHNQNNDVQTESVHNNGFNPMWEFKCELIITVPELAILDLKVKDYSKSGADHHLGSVAIPVPLLQEGYRRAYLVDYSGKKLNPASLFVKVEKVPL